jgi:ArsR family transcriptional regulator, arsenate/arsenite/antimonite-responsive transcriptional repressor
VSKPAATARPADSAKAVRDLAHLFKALGDEHRLTILALLVEHGELNVTDLGQRLGQSQPAVSHHLNQLRAAGLIDYRRSGKFNFYALNPAGLHPLFDNLVPDGTPAKLALAGVEVAVKRK